MSRRERPTLQVAVDMVRCGGHGICAWLAPDVIGLDEWGFAFADPAPVSGSRQRRQVTRAARACPRHALTVQAIEPHPQPQRPTVSS